MGQENALKFLLQKCNQNFTYTIHLYICLHRNCKSFCIQKVGSIKQSKIKMRTFLDNKKISRQAKYLEGGSSCPMPSLCQDATVRRQRPYLIERDLSTSSSSPALFCLSRLTSPKSPESSSWRSCWLFMIADVEPSLSGVDSKLGRHKSRDLHDTCASVPRVFFRCSLFREDDAGVGCS